MNTRRRRSPVAGALVCSFWFANALPACSCRGPRAPQLELERSELVAIVRVVTSDRHLRDAADYPSRSIEVEIIELFKGEFDNGSEIWTGRGGADCGFPFEINGAYLVYATIFRDRLFTSICHRTRKLEEATDEELEILRDSARRTEPQ